LGDGGDGDEEAAGGIVMNGWENTDGDGELMPEGLVELGGAET
jgi:hypothetical protein